MFNNESSVCQGLEQKSANKKKWLLLLLATIGPGLTVMLADTDAGSIITAAQSGAQWGYKLLCFAIFAYSDFIFCSRINNSYRYNDC